LNRKVNVELAKSRLFNPDVIAAAFIARVYSLQLFAHFDQFQNRAIATDIFIHTRILSIMTVAAVRVILRWCNNDVATTRAIILAKESKTRALG